MVLGQEPCQGRSGTGSSNVRPHRTLCAPSPNNASLVVKESNRRWEQLYYKIESRRLEMALERLEYNRKQQILRAGRKRRQRARPRRQLSFDDVDGALARSPVLPAHHPHLASSRHLDLVVPSEAGSGHDEDECCSSCRTTSSPPPPLKTVLVVATNHASKRNCTSEHPSPTSTANCNTDDAVRATKASQQKSPSCHQKKKHCTSPRQARPGVEQGGLERQARHQDFTIQEIAIVKDPIPPSPTTFALPNSPNGVSFRHRIVVPKPSKQRRPAAINGNLYASDSRIVYDHQDEQRAIRTATRRTQSARDAGQPPVQPTNAARRRQVRTARSALAERRWSRGEASCNCHQCSTCINARRPGIIATKSNKSNNSSSKSVTWSDQPEEVVVFTRTQPKRQPSSRFKHPCALMAKVRQQMKANLNDGLVTLKQTDSSTFRVSDVAASKHNVPPGLASTSPKKKKKQDAISTTSTSTASTSLGVYQTEPTVATPSTNPPPPFPPSPSPSLPPSTPPAASQRQSSDRQMSFSSSSLTELDVVAISPASSSASTSPISTVIVVRNHHSDEQTKVEESVKTSPNPSSSSSSPRQQDSSDSKSTGMRSLVSNSIISQSMSSTFSQELVVLGPGHRRCFIDPSLGNTTASESAPSIGSR